MTLSLRAKTLIAFVVCLVSFFDFSRAIAQPRTVEKVVAVVNEDAVYLSELRQRSIPMLEQILSAPTPQEQQARLQEVQSKILEMLIDEKLMMQEAEKSKIVITDAEVNRSLKNWREQQGMDEIEFWSTVRAQGMSESEYRDQLRRQLLQYKLLNQRVRARVKISEEDVRERYLEQTRKAKRSVRFHASHLVFAVDGDASESQRIAAKAQANEILTTLTEENFAAKIEEYAGGDLGWLSQGDLPDVLERALLSLEKGQMSKPIRGPSGYHIFFLHDRERGGADIPPFEEMKGQLHQQMMNKAMVKQQKLFLDELRRKATITLHDSE